MPILGCKSIEEAFALLQQEEQRAGRRGEFYEFIQSVPIVPILQNTPDGEEMLAQAATMSQVKLLVHQAMSRPGTIRSNFIFNETEKKLAVQVRQTLARSTFPMKERARLQVIGLHPETRRLRMTLAQNVYGSLSQEAKIQDLKDSIIAMLAQTEDHDFRDRYTFGVVSFRADGRNKKDSPDPDYNYFGLLVLDDFTDKQKADNLKALYPDLSEVDRVRQFDTTKLQRFGKLQNGGLCAQELNEDPLNKGQPFMVPPSFFHLQKYLEKLKWPINKYAPLDLKITLFERRVADVIDQIPTVDTSFPKWSRLDATNAEPPAYPVRANTIFTADVKIIRETMEMFRKLKFSLGSDNFQPFEGMTLRLLQPIPEVLAQKMTMDDFYSTLRTERAYVGQVFNQTDAINTPEAYKEILKLIDITGIAQRLMIKSTLILLSQLEETDPLDVDPTELMVEWCLSFKEKLVMLFVNSFLIGAEAEFLNGEIFQQSLRVVSEEQWTKFAVQIKSENLQLRNHRKPDQYLVHLQSTIEFLKKENPSWEEGLKKVWKMVNYQFTSPKPVNQCLEQLAQVCWTLHKLPDKLAYKHNWVLLDPQVRQRLDANNTRLDQVYLRKLNQNPVELKYQLRFKKLLLTADKIRQENVAACTSHPTLTSNDIEDLLDPILFRFPRNKSFPSWYDYENPQKMLRSGEAALFLDSQTKTRLQIEAYFRPNLHAIAYPSADDVIESTDTSEVLQKIKLSREHDLLPTEKIRRSMESEFQCCHVEKKQRGYGRSRKYVMLKCQNKAAVGHLRCPMHLGMPASDPKAVINLLYSHEDLINSKKYQLLENVSIFIPLKKDDPYLRYPMSMEILDHMHQKEVVNFQILAEEMFQWWHQQRNNPQAKFPEQEFRHKFGNHAPHASWYHVSERMKFHMLELAPNQELPDSIEYYVEFLRFLTKKSGWFQYINGDDDFIPTNDNLSWAKPTNPKEDFKGDQIYYNAEVWPNAPNWFNYSKPLELNPQTGVIANEIPLYVLDVDNTLKLDEAACVHVRMTAHANDNKYGMINTEMDATNRIDQDISAPFMFTLDEFVDCADQKHPFPITTHSSAFGGTKPDHDNDDQPTLDGHYVDILGSKLPLQNLLDDMTLLTNTSIKNCKNNRKSVLENSELKWKDGTLESEWTGKIIHPNDEEGFREYIKAEMARLTAPILIAHMIRVTKKYAKRKIAIIFHITGYPDSIRFFKNRLHHCNEIPAYIRHHTRYADLFEGKTNVLELLDNVKLKFVIPVPTNGSFARPNGVKFHEKADTQEARGFQCYVQQPEINTFDFIVVTMRNDPKNPFSEYLVPIPSGFAVWSAVSDVANPSIVTNTLGEAKFNKNLDKLDERTPMGHRRDMLVCNSKMVRSKIIRHILANQKNSPKHSYVMVNDERVTVDSREMPILAAAYSQPLVVDAVDYHTTAHSAVTTYLLQAFKQMNPTLQTIVENDDEDESGMPSHLFSNLVGNGYVSPAGLLGFSGNGKFKQPMKLEQRDMIVTAAMHSKVQMYAETYVLWYESEFPESNEDKVAKQQRRYFQENLCHLWADKLQAYHYSIAGGIDGMGMYCRKFKFLGIDPDKSFRQSLREAMRDDPRNLRHPTVMKENEDLKKCLEQTTRESLSEDFFVEHPRTEMERMTFNQRQQLRLEYPPERAPAQYHLQKRTSELSLSTPPTVQSLTPLQIVANRTNMLRQQSKRTDTKKFSLLDEAQKIMRAHKKQGELYKGFSEENRAAFNEIRKIPPSKTHHKWLINKLSETDMDYQKFLDIMTFCHTDPSPDGNGSKFVMNYIRLAEIEIDLKKQIDEAQFTVIREMYKKLYEGQNLLRQLGNPEFGMKTALEMCGLYPEREAPRALPDEVYIYGNMGRAWARLASFFYKDRPIGALAPKEKKATYARGLPINNPDSTSDEDSEHELNEMRRTKRKDGKLSIRTRPRQRKDLQQAPTLPDIEGGNTEPSIIE